MYVQNPVTCKYVYYMYSLCIAIHVKLVNIVLIGVMHRQVRHTCTVVYKRQTSLRLTA